MSEPLILVDVGNTRTKVAVAGDPVEIAVRDTKHEPDSWLPVLLEAAGPPPWRWVIGGAAPARVDEIEAWVHARGEACLAVRTRSQVPVEVRGPDPEQVGMDRLLDCLSAVRRKRPGVPAVVVDGGTALVVNMVSANGALLGGGIMPGVATMLKALHLATAKLPAADAGDFAWPTWPGLTTQTALYAGCFHAALGGATHMITLAADGLADPPGGPVDVFVTGGDGPKLMAHIDWPEGCDAHLVETLTLEGLMQVAAG